MIQVLAKMEGHVLEGETPTLVYAKTAGKDPHVHRVCKVLGISYILLLTRIHADTVFKKTYVYILLMHQDKISYICFLYIYTTHSFSPMDYDRFQVLKLIMSFLLQMLMTAILIPGKIWKYFAL